jgi:hypothetical protein
MMMEIAFEGRLACPVFGDILDVLPLIPHSTI